MSKNRMHMLEVLQFNLSLIHYHWYGLQ